MIKGTYKNDFLGMFSDRLAYGDLSATDRNSLLISDVRVIYIALHRTFYIIHYESRTLQFALHIAQLSLHYQFITIHFSACIINISKLVTLAIKLFS